MYYAITYDISDSEEDHTAFFDRLKTLGRWMHYIDDTWILYTTVYLTANEIFEELEPLIDKEEDYILVIEIDPSNKQGWLPQDAWEWFKKQDQGEQ